MFSKWCFSDSPPQLATEENPFRGTKNAWKHQCFRAFWCLLRLRMPTALWTHHSEKHRLENTVCYCLAIAPRSEGLQNVRGENAPSRKFLDPSKRGCGELNLGFVYRNNRALTCEGGGKRTSRRSKVQNPFVKGRGCPSWGLPPTLFDPNYSSGASRGSLHGGASFKAEKAHLLHENGFGEP